MIGSQGLQVPGAGRRLGVRADSFNPVPRGALPTEARQLRVGAAALVQTPPPLQPLGRRP
ncbi:hypothetical protein H6G65_10585 [Microcystis elabens FACHB-917]|nr:hypothetical protein [Microcystis elabens FACHB-917]